MVPQPCWSRTLDSAPEPARDPSRHGSTGRRLPIREVTLWRGVGVDLYEQYKVGGNWWEGATCTGHGAQPERPEPCEGKDRNEPCEGKDSLMVPDDLGAKGFWV